MFLVVLVALCDPAILSTEKDECFFRRRQRFLCSVPFATKLARLAGSNDKNTDASCIFKCPHESDAPKIARIDDRPDAHSPARQKRRSHVWNVRFGEFWKKLMVMRKNFRIFFRLLLWGDSGIES